jgi:hypothetical protein
MSLLCHEVLQQVEDLRLRGDVERGGGFIGDQQPRVQRDGRGDADALPLAAGQLMGVAVEPDMGQADAVQPVAGDGARLRPVGLPVDRAAFRPPGRRWSAPGSAPSSVPGRSSRSHCRAARTSGLGQGQQVGAVERDRAPWPRAVGQEAHERQRRHRLARAAFADQAEDLARAMASETSRRIGVPWMVSDRVSIDHGADHRTVLEDYSACPAAAGVERIAQPVAHQVQAQHHQHDGEPRQDRQHRVV